MNLWKTWKMVQSLRPDQKSFMRSKLAHTTRTREAWMEFLIPCCEVDTQLDKLRLWFAWMGGVLVAAGPVFAFVLETPMPLLFSLLGLLILIGRFRIARWDLPAAPKKYLLPLLALLQEETQSNSLIEMNMDFRGFNQKEKLVSAEGPSTDKLETFANPWLQVKTHLADGSQLNWDYVDRVRKRHRRKRTMSGKTKWKTKIKVRRVLDIRLRILTKQFPNLLTSVETKMGAMSVAIEVGEKRSEIRVRHTFAPMTPDHSPEVQDFMSTVIVAYGKLPHSDQRRGVA